MAAVHVAQCPQANVACEFSEFGCTDQFPRHLVDKHMTETQEKHIRLLADVVKRQKKTIDELGQITACVSTPLSHAQKFCQNNWPQINQCLQEKSVKMREKFSKCLDNIRMMHIIAFTVVFMHVIFMPFFIKGFIFAAALFAYKKSRKLPMGPSTTLGVVAFAAFVSMLFRCNFFCWAILIGLGVGIYLRKRNEPRGCGSRC